MMMEIALSKRGQQTMKIELTGRVLPIGRHDHSLVDREVHGGGVHGREVEGRERREVHGCEVPGRSRRGVGDDVNGGRERMVMSGSRLCVVMSGSGRT